MKNEKAGTGNDLTTAFLAGKSEHSLALFDAFVAAYEQLGTISLYPTKTMIGIEYKATRIAWITQLGKHFIHVVLPFSQPYPDNLCFQKIAEVPGQLQFNHHLRILHKEDINEEVLRFMKMTMKV